MNADATAYGMEDPGPYVVTFAVSFERMPLAVPFVHELEHFSAFRSQTIERGRSVFRHHVGYFETRISARAALRVVRRHYTDAHISTAPHRGLGSLDDTGITEFSMARPAAAPPAAPRSPARARPAAGALPATSEPLCDAALQRYAIQLDVLRRADPSDRTPDLAVLRAHTLYRIHVLLDGVLHQALRLGFFPSVEAVQRALPGVRDRHPLANVVPISEREYARVRELVPGRGSEVVTAQVGAGPSISGSRAIALGSAERAGDGAWIGGNDDAPSGDDVCCEFGAHELPTADRAMPRQPPR